MTYLYLILASLALLGIYFIVTSYEMRRGTRFFESKRVAFDRFVERITFVLTHVDFAAFLRDEVRTVAKRLGHDFVQISLQGIRAVERLLTRVMKHLRSQNPMKSVSRESARPFIETLSNFKEHLASTRPQMFQVGE